MKKFVIMAAVVGVMSLSLIGCNSTEPTGDAGEETTVIEDVTEEITEESIEEETSEEETEADAEVEDATEAETVAAN